MKNHWELSIKTSLPGTRKSPVDLKVSVLRFDEFESARNAMRSCMKNFAYSENAMFDGAGNLVYLDGYIDFSDDYIGDEDTNKWLVKIRDILHHIFSGEDIRLDDFEHYYTDYFIAVDISTDEIFLHAGKDGRINGYAPIIRTNIFDMKEEKDYYLYIDDMFEQDVSSELYIDLKNVTE